MGVQQMLLAVNKAASVTHTYTTGSGAAETVPASVSSVTIEVWGPGGDGAVAVPPNGGAGSGGYSATENLACSPGQTLTYTVGVHASTASSVSSGTLTIATMTCTSGSNGINGTSSGGTATGGTSVNINGSGSSTTTGANSTGPGGGAGGTGGVTTGNPGGAPGGGGGEGVVTGGAGGNGQVRFTYT